MPELTRRRIDNHHRETWHVHFGDVHVGTIGRRAGVPIHADQWGWSCGFYPGLKPGQHRSGTAETFEAARAGFEADWNALLLDIPEGAFDKHRCHRAFHLWKETMWAAGLSLPTQVASGRARCYCGEEIEIESVGLHVDTEHIT